MSWTTNPIMEWSTDGTVWTRITDHGRSPLSISIERIENTQRMANGRMRRYVVAKKRTFTCSWDNLPDKASSFLANGQPGNWMEAFHNANDGSFKMRLRSGVDQGKTNLPRAGGEDSLDNERTFDVMITDFSKQVVKRGTVFDLWNLDMTLEEV